MANSVSIKVDGLRALGERIKNLSNDMAGKVARAATASAAGVVKKDAAKRAPVAAEDYVVEGLPVKKGNLPKNIVTKRLKPADTNLTSEHIVTVRGKRKYGYASRIGALTEFGTIKQPPRPFLRPALESNIQPAVDAMKKRLEARLKKAGV